MKVTLRFHGIFAEDIGSKETSLSLETDETNLREIIHKLYVKSRDKTKKIIERLYTKDGARIIILVNGRNAVYTGWLNTPIKDGDVIDIIPPLAGG